MRIATFIPAVLALTLFSASQAAPTLHDTTAISMLQKRGIDGVEAFIHLYEKTTVDAVVKTCDEIEVKLCADVVVDLHVKANILGGLITAKVDVDNLKIQTKAKVDADVKAEAKAHLKVKAVAPIAVIVHESILALCPIVNDKCLKKNAHAIVAKVNAKIRVNVSKLIVKLRAHIDDHVRIRIKAIVDEVCVHLGIAEATVTAKAWVASNIDVHVKVWVDVWVKIWAKINLKALIKAL
ncbi:hypothetical protein BGZ95_000634 [Linnemannia exigua]|uniref:Uncharacterized protein n=1 Tax=Linnemannia exigua TaxID=604196 RepID=A0AAD4D7Z4_9FUNG|nr:hypothetical protein BGZ95_000634 [Linnemannia exigua]